MRFNHVRALLGLLCVLSLFVLFPTARQQAQSKKPSLKPFAEFHTHDADAVGVDGLTDSYVLTRDNGQTVCRPMSEAEGSSLRFDNERAGLKVINSRRDAQRQAQQSQQSQAGLKIILRGTSQLDNFPQAKEAFTRAAAVWESVIESPITVVIDVDFGTTRFGQVYPANVIGSTNPQTLDDPELYPDLRAALIAGAQTPEQATIFNALPMGAMTFDMGTTKAGVATSAVLRALGFLDATANPDGEREYGNPPAIGFNSTLPFDFDPSDGVDFDKIDFDATAVHEIGHALGFGSQAGYRELSATISLAPSIWDLYRFHPGVGLNTFGAEPRSLLSGGDQELFAGGDEFGLSTGRPDGSGGDGRQASHWKDDVATGQFVGIMDPTAADGLREEFTSADLTTLGLFGYRVKPDATVSELLSVDDGSRESGTGATTSLVVNRFTPARYPATVKGARVVVRVTSDQPSPAGAPLRLVVFNDPNRTGLLSSNSAPLFERTVTIPNITGTRFIEFSFNGPTINSGDLYIGVQAMGAAVQFGVDTTGQPLQERSFISSDNGANYQTLKSSLGNVSAAKLMLRALVSEPFNANPTPALATVSPSAVPPGSQAFKLAVQGSGFKADSVVKWNGDNRPTTFLSSSRLQASISAADIASAGEASVTVFTSAPSGGDSTALKVSITPNDPVPVITALTPNQQAVGVADAVLTVIGRDFNPSSTIRINGNQRATIFVDSTQLSTTLTVSDLATTGNVTVSVFTNSKVSNELTLSVVPCGFSLSSSTQSFAATGGLGGVVLSTNSPCAWNASSDAPWVTITTPDNASGVGRNVINYRIAANTAPGVRAANVMIGGQTILIRQAGVLTTVSAANFSASIAPESIVAAFGLGLAGSTQIAQATPLPTNLGGATVRVTDSKGQARSAPIFFVSANQVNYQIPSGTATGSATISVTVDGALIATGTANISTVAPSLFAANANGQGIAAAVLLRLKPGGEQTFETISSFDQTQNKFIAQPIDLGPDGDQVFLILFGTGVRGRSALSAVSVKVGDIDAAPQFAGPQGTLIGVDQLNIPLARTLKGRGEVTINLTIDGKMANPVTVTVQ